MIPVYKPENQSDLAIILSILQEHDIPYFVHNGGFGSLCPGLQIELFNAQTIMVPPSAADTARKLIEDFIESKPIHETSEKMGIKDKLRIVFEGLLLGWFIPGSKRYKNSKDKN